MFQPLKGKHGRSDNGHTEGLVYADNVFMFQPLKGKHGRSDDRLAEVLS